MHRFVFFRYCGEDLLLFMTIRIHANIFSLLRTEFFLCGPYNGPGVDSQDWTVHDLTNYIGIPCPQLRHGLFFNFLTAILR